MPRTARHAPAGWSYHALNRAVARLPLLRKAADYESFEAVLTEARKRVPLDIFAYCLMPNHWHFVVRPNEDGQLTEFLRWMTQTHTMRWHAHHHTLGTGHLYQGRFQSFPVQDDDHFYTLVRYVERNALRAGLVSEAQDWRWSSLWRQVSGNAESRALLARWPVSRPRDWLERVNTPQADAELDAIRRAVRRGSPFGATEWQKRTSEQLGLQSTLRARGRPRKPSNPDE
jgi:putative transposase